MITFAGDNGVTVTVQNGEAGSRIVGGYGIWTTIARPKRASLTRYDGRNPYTQDISVLFDGFSDGTGQNTLIQKLESLALPVGTLKEPPKIRLAGNARMTYLTWVISGIDWDDNLTIAEDGGNGAPLYLRMGGTIHLTEYVNDDVISTKTTPDPSTTNNKKVVTPTGMTLKQIAMLEYKDPSKYILILWSNPFLDPDPRKIIPAGVTLYIPSADSTGFGKTIQVP